VLLSLLVWIPVVGALAIALWPGEVNAARARQAAILNWIGLVIVTGAIISQFDPNTQQIELVEAFSWIDRLGLSYSLGIDGLSFPLVVLNTLLAGIAIFSTNEAISRPRFYYSLMLLLTSGLYGAFLAQDLLLFFLFYELELIPLYFLIAIWGGARRGYAATKFLIYTALSGILILAAFLGLAGSTGFASFSYDRLRDFAIAQASAPDSLLPIATQLLLLALILVGFGIKIPLVPLHTWLPDAHVEASTPISVLLAGVLLKLGTYGLIRFGLGLFPEAWSQITPLLAAWAVVSVLYGSFAAISEGLAKGDMKRLVAYSSVGHMGFILLAVAAATPVSLMGAEFQMVSHGLISGLLFLLVGIVYTKVGTRQLSALGGLFNPQRGLPVVGSLMVLGVMASSGIPGMAGFIAEFLIFRGSFPAYPVHTLLCMLGTGLTAVYFLILLNQSFFGRLTERVSHLPSVSWLDRAPAIALSILIALFGLQPSWLAYWSESVTTALAVSTHIGP
jgi:NAD(P)H-quinone oxidoreductase subunit 4